MDGIDARMTGLTYVPQTVDAANRLVAYGRGSSYKSTELTKGLAQRITTRSEIRPLKSFYVFQRYIRSLLFASHQSGSGSITMKNNTLRNALMGLLLVVSLAGCGPAYVGVGTGPAYPAYGYYAPRPYYPMPYYGYRRPPVYVAPPRAYYSRPRYYSSPNYSYRYNNPRLYNGGRRR
jgi:hypothetical protein